MRLIACSSPCVMRCVLGNSCSSLSPCNKRINTHRLEAGVHDTFQSRALKRSCMCFTVSKTVYSIPAYLGASTVSKHAHNAVYCCIHVYLRQASCHRTALQCRVVQQIIDDTSLLQAAVYL
eukprot:11590-Heterococcus_DN1.PRE.3